MPRVVVDRAMLPAAWCLAALISAAPVPEKRLLVPALSGPKSEIAQQASAALLAACRAAPGYKTLGAEEMRTIAEFGGSAAVLACAEDACVPEMTSGLRGDVVVLGTVGPVGDSLVVTLRLIDTHGVVQAR